MRVSQRQVMLALLGILSFGAITIGIYEIFVPDTQLTTIGTAISIPVLLALLITYWRGWEPARYLTLIFITLVIGFVTDGVYLTEQFTMPAFLPPLLALIIADPLWVIGSALALLLILIVRAGGHGIYVDPVTLILYAMPVGAIVLARLVTNTAQHDAEANASQARHALEQAEAQTHELARQAQELETQNKQQRQLLDLVATLETPAVAVSDGVLLAPVVGHLDSRRASNLTQRLLHEVGAQRAHMVILDLAGVPTVDTAVAHALLQTIQAVRLLGCEVTITGISASVAATMTQLGINMAGVRTAPTPQAVMRASN